MGVLRRGGAAKCAHRRLESRGFGHVALVPDHQVVDELERVLHELELLVLRVAASQGPASDRRAASRYAMACATCLGLTLGAHLSLSPAAFDCSRWNSSMLFSTNAASMVTPCSFALSRNESRNVFGTVGGFPGPLHLNSGSMGS